MPAEGRRKGKRRSPEVRLPFTVSRIPDILRRMELTTILTTIVLSLLPISELRGAIPYAVARGVPLPAAFLLAVACNALVAPAAFLFLTTLHGFLYRWAFYARLFDGFVRRVRGRIGASVERYGYWGLFLFVAVPLPVTGAWTGAVGAWVLGMGKRKASLYISLGVLTAGLIVSAVVGLGAGALSIFLKRI